MTTSSRTRRAFKNVTAHAARARWNRARIVGWGLALGASIAVWAVIVIALLRLL